MLAYVYGVVPISLCRSGGCGVSAGNGKGVRIEFDDENDMNVGSGAAATGKLHCFHPHPQLPTLTPKSDPVCFCPSQRTTEFAFCWLIHCWVLVQMKSVAGLTDGRSAFALFLSYKKGLFVPLLWECFLDKYPHRFQSFVHFSLIGYSTARDYIFHLLFLDVEVLFLLCRYYFSGRHQKQPQYRWRQCWGADGQSECQRQPHGPSGGHQGQPEWDGVHHGLGRSQHYRQPLRQCHGQLLKQVLKQHTTHAMGFKCWHRAVCKHRLQARQPTI